MFRDNKAQSEQDAGGMPVALPGFEHINRYWDTKQDIFAAKIMPGEYYVTLHGEMIITVLGSCVSACIRDAESGIGGMNHFMLPDLNMYKTPRWENTPVSIATRYGNVAMERLINVIIANGGQRKNLEIKLFGGGKVLNMSMDVGAKNIEFVKNYLHTENLDIAAVDLGGIYPRKVMYFPASGRVQMKNLNRMHNDTMYMREQKYIDNLMHEKLDGKVDIFR